MLTGLGIGMIGAGVLLVWAGVTGQSLTEELRNVFGGGDKAAGPPAFPATGPRPPGVQGPVLP